MKNEKKTVTVKIGDKDFTDTYDKSSYETREDLLTAIQTDDGLSKILADLNYGWDLKQRSVVRQRILDTQTGPEKAVEKLVKDLIKVYGTMGKTLSPEAAMKLVKASMPSDESEAA